MRNWKQFVVLAVLVAGLTANAAPPTEASRKAVQIAAVGFAANRNSFPYSTCKYVVTRAEAASPEAALAGQWQNRVTADYRLISDGDRELVECVAPVPAIPKGKPDPKTGMQIVTGSFMPHAMISDGPKAVGYSPSMKVANLFNASKPPPTENTTPWSVGTFGPRSKWAGPDVMIERAGEFTMTAAGLKVDQGRPVVSAAFDSPTRRSNTTFRLDPSRGYLPVHVTAHFAGMPQVNGLPYQMCHLTEARECSGGRWFPTRWLLVRAPGTPGGPYNLVELHVTELDVDRRPKPADFAITIPAGTMICSSVYVDPVLFFTTKQDEKVSLDDIDTLFTMLKESKQQPRMDTAVPHRTRLPRWAWPAGALGLLGGVGLLVRYRVRRKRRKARLAEAGL